MPAVPSAREDVEKARLLDLEANSLSQQLSVEEKVAVLSGNGMWEAGGVPRLGIEALRMSDGPNGARGCSLHGTDGAALVPCHSALAASFNEELITKVGDLLGREAADRGVHVLLAPTLNMHRSPITGRHFECFSEDPFLTSRAAVAYIRGVQRHSAACAKHFVGNDQEADRGHSNSVISDRALHEIYLLPFEAAVREADVHSIMPGYNRLNGEYCAENPQLIQGVLRDTWGFKGFVVSDWWANRTTLEAIQAGLNVEMPGIEPRFYGGHLLQKVKSGEVSEKLLDDRCEPILRTLLRYPRKEHKSFRDLAERKAICVRAAAESLVLLKNEESSLPLKVSSLRRIAVIGPNAATTTLQGGGSSRVHPEHASSILEAISEAMAPEVQVQHLRGCRQGERPFTNPELEGLKGMGGCDASGQPIPNNSKVKFLDTILSIAAWCSNKEWFRSSCVPCLRPFGLKHTDPGEAGRSLISAQAPSAEEDPAFNNCLTRFTASLGGLGVGALAAVGAGAAKLLMAPIGAVCGLALGEAFIRKGNADARAENHQEDLDIAEAEALVASVDATVLVLGTNGFWECEGVDQPHMRLPGRQDELVKRCAAAAHAAGRPLVVVLNVGSPKELPWLSEVSAVLLSYFGGEGCAAAVASTLLGKDVPAGRLPTTWPSCLEEASAVAAALAEEKKSGSTTGGTQGDVRYYEGLNLGYRGLETLPEPVFPFGHGLSYTSFEYGSVQAQLLEPPQPEAGHATAAVQLKVKNMGAVAGSEVVQLYSTTKGTPKALRAFTRTRILAPGEEVYLSLQLDERALGGHFVPEKGSWVPPSKGTRVLLEVGASSKDIRQTAELHL